MPRLASCRVVSYRCSVRLRVRFALSHYNTFTARWASQPRSSIGVQHLARSSPAYKSRQPRASSSSSLRTESRLPFCPLPPSSRVAMAARGVADVARFASHRDWCVWGCLGVCMCMCLGVCVLVCTIRHHLSFEPEFLNCLSLSKLVPAFSINGYTFHSPSSGSSSPVLAPSPSQSAFQFQLPLLAQLQQIRQWQPLNNDLTVPSTLSNMHHKLRFL